MQEPPELDLRLLASVSDVVFDAAGILMAGYPLGLSDAVTATVLSAQLLQVPVEDVATYVQWCGALPF